MSLALLGLSIGLLLLPELAQSQGPAQPPIVTVSGRVYDRGTIVMEDGLITAVGGNVQVPGGAWVIDGEGLTVYPGMVDALSSVGLPASLRETEGRGRPGSGQGTQQQAAH